MRVVVVGCGYVGLELAAQLAASGHAVTGVRRSDAGLDAIEAVGERAGGDGGVDAVRADATDPSSLDALPDADAVVFAASSGGRGAEAAREVYVDGLRNVVEAYAAATVDGEGNVGGLAGTLTGAELVRSSAAVEASGAERVGGLAGSSGSRSSIAASFASGSVDGTAKTGGLVGRNSGSLRNLVATAAVSGDESTGSVLGEHTGSATDLYWDRESSGVGGAVGDGDSVGTGLSTDEMTGSAARSNMAGLDFGGAWITTDSYPVLAHLVDGVSVSVPDQVITDRPATATVSLSLADGRTVTASETADYSTNQSFLSVDRGVLETSGTGMAKVTATVAGHSDSATVSVVTPPDISVESRSLRYDRVGSETAAPVDVTLTNDGGADGTFDVVLSVNGTVEETRTVTVPGHSTTAVQLNYSAPATGTYPVAINGTSLGNLTVVEEPETSVTAASLSENLLAIGNSTTVAVKIENSGGAAAGHAVELTAGGETVATKTVVVPVAGTAITFNYTGDSAGEYDLAVDGTSAGTVTVAERGSVSVESVSVPDSVEAGASYEVTITLANSGGLPLNSEVAYSIGGSAVGSETVEVSAEGTTVTFEATAPADSESIDHSVTAGDAEWTGSTVVDVETATPTATAGPSGDGDAADGSDGSDGDAATATSGDGPGFGVGAALVALLTIAVFGRRETN